MVHFFKLLHGYHLDAYLLTFLAFYLFLFFLQSRCDLIGKIIQLTKHLSSSKTFLIIIFLVSFLILSFFANSVLQRFPHSGNEYNFIFQAETFLKGRLWNSAPPQEHFKFGALINRDGKWLSRVPPGWPFIITIAMFFHIPAWLVNPILGTASLILLFFLAQLLYSNTVALLSVLAVLCSPFFLFNASSYVPHISCGLLILAAVYLFCSLHLRKNPSMDICWIGACFGAAFLIRPFSSLACIIPMLIALIIKRRWEFFQKDIWYLMLGMGPFLLINFLYNYFITGNFLLSPFNWYDTHDTIQFKRSILLDNVKSVENQFVWMNPAIFVLYFWTVISLSFKRKIQTQELFFFIIVIACFFYFVPAISYGSRYYYEGYFLCVLTVIGRLSYFKDGAIKKQLTLALLAGFLTSLLTVPIYAVQYKNLIDRKSELYRLVEEKHLSNAIVLIPSKGTPMPSDDMTRNDPDLQNKVLYVHDLKDKNALLLKYFPSRDFYLYVPGEKNEEQRLQKYTIPHSN